MNRFESDIVPIIELELKAQNLDSSLGSRLVKSMVLLLNNITSLSTVLDETDKKRFKTALDKATELKPRIK
jgi:hypothetical protein